jgi:outer membrane protein TolC
MLKVILIFHFQTTIAQNANYLLDLDDCVAEAKRNSLRAKVAATKLKLSELEYKVFRTTVRPQVSAFGNIPGYYKEFLPITQPDGAISFERVEQSFSNIGISLSQTLSATGGEISLNTSVTKFRDFQRKLTQYNSVPIFVKFSQPIFAVNSWRWLRKIEPLRFKEAVQLNEQEQIRIASEVTTLFFDLLAAQAQQSLANSNRVESYWNFTLEKKKVPLGTTSDDRLLQWEIQVLKAEQQLQLATQRLTSTELSLKSFLGRSDTNSLRVALPQTVPSVSLTLPQALDAMKRKHPRYLSLERQRLEVEQQLALAKAAQRNINLTATYGLNGAASDFANVFLNLQNQQRFTVGFNLPILDWGRRSAAVDAAKAEQELFRNAALLEQNQLVSQLITLYTQLPALFQNISTALSLRDLTNRRFIILNEQFRVGRAGSTELLLVQIEKDSAYERYIDALRNYWESWYLLQQLTVGETEL